MARVIFTLKQHTPIIHFQPEQGGATLRATELKPKLNRFLIEKVDNLPIKTTKDGKRRYLDYKVKIEPNLSGSTKIKKPSLYFGNMGNNKKKKEPIKRNESFKISFFSFNREIIDAIKENFEAFLANHNFGTRQSKGYGSFYIDNKDLDINLIDSDIVYNFKSNKWEKDINLLYKFLRQGINYPDSFYAKPAIFAYAKKKKWTWEKRVIKESFFKSDLNNQIKKHNSDVLTFSSNKKYILRDLFGLSTSQSWMSYGATIEKEDKRGEIDRFKSPITFKVVNNRVYFWVNDSYKKILGREFKIIKKGGGRESISLKFPSEFDFNDFLNFAFKEIDLKRHIDSEFHNKIDYKTLNRILKEIQIYYKVKR